MTRSVPRGQHELAKPTTRPEASVTIHGVSHEYFVYHGTIQSKLLPILSNGLIGVDGRAKRHGVSHDGVLYATERMLTAARFAAVNEQGGIAGLFTTPTRTRQGVVLKIALTEAEFQKFQKDPDWTSEDVVSNRAVMCECVVSPEHIVGIANATVEPGLDLSSDFPSWEAVMRVGEFVTPRQFVARHKALKALEVSQ